MIVNKHILHDLTKHSSDENCPVFIDELMSIYNDEKKLNASLPRMIMNAKSPEIVTALTKHLKFTQEHLLRLETLFSSLNLPIKNKKI